MYVSGCLGIYEFVGGVCVEVLVCVCVSVSVRVFIGRVVGYLGARSKH